MGPGYKKGVISIVAIVVVTWILISSLSSIPVVKSSSSGSGTGQGGGSGSNTGLGSGFGSGFGFSLPNLNLSLPHLNLNLGALFRAPNFHFKWPKFNITLPPANFNSTKTNSTSSSPGGGGGHGGQGTSNSVNSKVNVIQQILLNPIFLIILIGAIAVIMSVYATRKLGGNRIKKKGGRNKNVKNDYKESYDSRADKDDILQVAPETNRPSDSEPRNYIFKLKKFMGWEGMGYIKPKIPEDMPLIWDYSSPLDIEIDRNMQIDSPDSKLKGNFPKGNLNMSVQKGLNKIRGIWNEGSEEKDIMGINIREDAQKQLTGNIGGELMNSLKNKTLRELGNSEGFQNLVSDKLSAEKLIKIYERIYYGQKRINSNEYYEFLRYLRNSMKDPKMFM